MNIMRMLPYLLMNVVAGEGEGGGGGTPETVNVSLPGGVSIALPKAQAETYLKAAKAANDERLNLSTRITSIDADRATAAAAATRAEQERDAVKAAAAGETEKARQLFSAEITGKLTTLQKRLVEREIDAAIRAANPGIDDSGLSDMRSLIAPRASYDEATGSAVMTDDRGQPLVVDGIPVAVSAHLPEWLKTRPHFQYAKVPAGNGGTPQPGNGIALKTIRLADLASADSATIKGVTSGAIKVIE